MNIIILGAGAIGSLFGALLSKENNVTLIGRTPHVNHIKKKSLTIKGLTSLNVNIKAEDSIKKISNIPDLLILTVKSFDTRNSINQVTKIISENTIILSLQNGLDNIEKIEEVIDKKQIIAGITTQGAFFHKPGTIRHTGMGITMIGEINTKKTSRIKNIVKLFNEAGIQAKVSNNIIKELWIKAIINSSINPLTTIFNCKNGYLLKNPILEKIVEKICKESTNIANSTGIALSHRQTIQKTKNVIKNTSENFSSMLQSFNRSKKTEIDAINGKFVHIGKIHRLDIKLNEILIYFIKNMSV